MVSNSFADSGHRPQQLFLFYVKKSLVSKTFEASRRHITQKSLFKLKPAFDRTGEVCLQDAVLIWSVTKSGDQVMARRKRKTNKSKHKQSLGTGKLGNYKPWISVRDFGSRGVVTRIKGLKTGRVHHLFSFLELYWFYFLDWSEEVIDIREQFPLFLPETLAIAKRLKIAHPSIRVPIPKTSAPTGKSLVKPSVARFVKEQVIMTTDFLVTMRRKPFGTYQIALNVKYSKDLANARTIKKFEIERVYWESRGVKWAIMTEREINRTMTQNIEWVHSFHTPDWLLEGMSKQILHQCSDFLFSILCDGRTSVRNATKASDKFFNFTPGVSLLIVRHLIAVRKWQVDMSSLIDTGKPLHISLNKTTGELV